jgi:tetratricopeptide (TPR) repeat protein/type II secretory pathway predicted ATPase ExeA
MSSGLEQAIKQRNLKAIMDLMFETGSPVLKTGYKTENELWDFKSDCPLPGKAHLNAWADLAKEILCFHNKSGGILFFGISDNDYNFYGATIRLDSKLINDQLRKFIGDRIWIDFYREFIQLDQRYLGVALIPPRGPLIEKFRIDAPRDSDGKRKFRKGYSAIREGDSCKILDFKALSQYSRDLFFPTYGKIYEIDEPFFRILGPEYKQFVMRDDYGAQIEQTIRDSRTAIAAVTGIGGVGKTAISTWAAIRAYECKDFDFIVSITAKDRELTSAGIAALKPDLTSFENLLDNILYVLDFQEKKTLSIDDKEKAVREIIEGTNGLLYVDNLETVDDKRIITFLDNLPLGVHAITTSRRTSVRVSARPIEIGPFKENEVVKFIKILSEEPGLTYLKELTDSEAIRVGHSCDHIPLAIKWTLCKSRSAAEAIAKSEKFAQTGKHGEELLQFSFRGIFSSMPGPEKAILNVLSVFQRPLPIEAILVGTELTSYKLQDTLETLTNDSLVQNIFDPSLNDYVYTTLPIVKAFVNNELYSQPRVSEKIRKNLSNYYEAKDIKSVEERVIVRELRQGTKDVGSSLVDLAKSAEKRNDIEGAKDLYDQAIIRDPTNWKALKEFAEFYRHKLVNPSMAIQLYDQAAANAPVHGPDRALIFRERGMLYRDSGLPDATDIAIECFLIAYKISPNDRITIHALAHMYDRKGQFGKVINLLEPLRKHHSKLTRKKSLPLLLKAYQSNGDMLKEVEIKDEICLLENDPECKF